MASKRGVRRRAEAVKRRRHEKSCERKRRYETRQSARRALIRLIIHHPSPTLLQSYYCHSCHGFHFGHARGEKPAAPVIQKRRAEWLQRCRERAAAAQPAERPTLATSDQFAAA